MEDYINDAINTMVWYVERYNRDFAFGMEVANGLLEAYQRGGDLCRIYNEALRQQMCDTMGNAMPKYYFDPPIMRAYHYPQGARAWFDSTVAIAIAGGFDSMLAAYNADVPLEDIFAGDEVATPPYKLTYTGNMWQTVGTITSLDISHISF